MRIAEGSSIEFVIDEIPVSMDYDIIIRYETQVMIVIRWYLQVFIYLAVWLSGDM